MSNQEFDVVRHSEVVVNSGNNQWETRADAWPLEHCDTNHQYYEQNSAVHPTPETVEQRSKPSLLVMNTCGSIKLARFYIVNGKMQRELGQ